MTRESSMKLNTLNQALEAELADIYDAEQQLVKMDRTIDRFFASSCTVVAGG